MRGADFRRQLNIIPRALPEILFLSEQIINPEWLSGSEPDRCEIEIDETGLLRETIQIHDRNDYFRVVVARLAVANDRRIIDIMESQIAIFLQRRTSFCESS